jgi:hypothetical protein
VFTSRLFRVPDYQRGYAWEKRQIQDLLDDLEWLGEGKVHYTGTLVIQKTPGAPKRMDSAGRAYTTYDLVDGQQRLTSIILLLDGIRRSLEVQRAHPDLVGGIVKTYVATTDLIGQPMPKLTLNRDCQPFFFETVLGHRPGVGGPRIRSHRLLADARRHIEAYLEKQAGTRGAEYALWLVELYTKITQQIEFMVYPVGSEADAGVIFETMNDRGKTLTELEKVKNYLLYLASKLVLPAEHDLTAAIDGAWTHIFSTLMAYGLTDTERDKHEDRLLRAHWLMKYNHKADEWEGSRSIKARFSLSKFQADHAGLLRALKDYVAALKDAATAYCEAYNPEMDGAFGDIADLELRKTVVRSASKLGRMRQVTPFLPLLLAARLRFPGDGNRYKQVVDLCERFAFRVYLFRGLRSHTGQSTMARLGHNLYNGTAIDAVVNELKRALFAYCSDEQFSAAFDLTAEPGDWYAWAGVRYFLYEFEEHLAAEQRLPVKMPWEEIDRCEKKDTIEHILPQHPASEGYWVERFTPELRRRYTHDIGNLCLTYYNPVLGNKPFPEKRGRPGVRGAYAESYLFSERELAACEDWTEAAILARRARLRDWALVRWHVDPPPATVNGTGGLEAIEALAEVNGVGDAFERLIEAARAQGLGLRPHKRSVVLSPPRKGTRALAAVWPKPGELLTGIWFDQFPKFFPVTADVVQEALGSSVWRRLTAENIDDFVDRLSALFVEIRRRT